MRLPLSRASFFLLAALIIPACSSNHSSAPPFFPPLARFAYVASNDGTLSGYSVDTQSGQLTAAGFAAAYTGAVPPAVQQVALAPGGQHAWVLR
ncbi:MAG TPA: hypothetical protein VKW04_16605, partial [Planctomycetota bacterium]|nr:hypothetical protein [Planctomycetota bacterium]